MSETFNVQFVESANEVTDAKFGTIALGLSAYQLAVVNGYTGTLTEWLASLKGDRGDVGEAAGFGTPTISVTKLDAGAEPTASVSASGANTAKIFSFILGIPKGDQGEKGNTGVGISGIALTHSEGLVDTYTVTFDNGSTTAFTVTNGAKGDVGQTGSSLEFIWSGTQLGIRVQGETQYTYVDLKGDKGDRGETGLTGDTGATGNGIASVAYKGTDANGGNIYTITMTNGAAYDFTAAKGSQGSQGDRGDTGATGATGNGVQSFALVSGTHAAGTMDTYRMTMTDGTTTDVLVYNGANGQGSGDMLAATYDPAGKSAQIATAAELAAHNTNASSHSTLFASKLGTSGNASNVTNAFTQASSRANLATGEKLSVSLGKIMKYFADLGTAAFSAATAFAAAVHTHVKADITDFPTSMPASDVYAWAKASNKPTYTASEVGADASGAASTAVSTHNSASDAHNTLFADKQAKIAVSGLLKGDGAGGVIAADAAALKSLLDTLSAVAPATGDKIPLTDISGEVAGYSTIADILSLVTPGAQIATGNSNLLDNGDFSSTINTKGATSYLYGGATIAAGTYTIDRWFLTSGFNSGLNVVVNSGYVSLTGNTNGWCSFAQAAANAAQLAGKTVTLTANIKAYHGDIYLGIGTTTSGSPTYYTKIAGTGYVSVTCTIPTDAAQVWPLLQLTSGSGVDLYGLKLEIGSVSTLANDAPAIRPLELLRVIGDAKSLGGIGGLPVIYNTSYTGAGGTSKSITFPFVPNLVMITGSGTGKALYFITPLGGFNISITSSGNVFNYNHQFSGKTWDMPDLDASGSTFAVTAFGTIA